MCEPATVLTIASLGAAAVGTGMKAYGEHQAGEQQARRDEANARLAGEAARDATARGEEEVKRYELEAVALLGRQRAVYGASGIDLSSASVQDVQRGTQALAAEDVRTIRNNAAREAWGYRAQGEQFQEQASATRSAAGWNVASTLLTGGLGMAESAYPTLKGGLPSGNRAPGMRAKYRGGR